MSITAHAHHHAPDRTKGPHSDHYKNQPGHWILARMGKRILRPGGRELTQRLLDALQIGVEDDVVEFAPGLGATARITLAQNPASYTAVERNPAAASIVQKLLTGSNQRCIEGSAEATGLPAGSASIVYGEAMLTMHGIQQKTAIAKEAFPVLRPGGRYGIHEIALIPDTMDAVTKRGILQSLASVVRVGVRPQSMREWIEILESAGFKVQQHQLAPMHLLEPRRVIRDEGFWRTLRFVFNVLRTPEARGRVLQMRDVFRRHREHLAAVMLIAEKP